MKRIVAIVVLVTLVLNCALRLRGKSHSRREPRYPIRPDDKIGEAIVINAEEREQLGLFPNIEGFKEARCNVTSGYGYEVEIVTETKRLVSVNEDPDAVTILLDYVNNYEEIEHNRASFEAWWGIVDYDPLGFPITKYQVAHVVRYGRAVACGCAGGLVVAVLTAAAVVIAMRNTDADYELGVGLGIFMAGMGLSAIAGGLAGCLTGVMVHQQDKKKAVEIIKEQRKPRVVE